MKTLPIIAHDFVANGNRTTNFQLLRNGKACACVRFSNGRVIDHSLTPDLAPKIEGIFRLARRTFNRSIPVIYSK